MQAFLKQNFVFFSSLVVVLAVFVAMSLYSCGLDSDLSTANEKLASARNGLTNQLSLQANYNDVAENLRVAQGDSNELAEARKSELTKLQTILSKDGILADADRKTSQDINGDLQNFIRIYRGKLFKKGIIVKGGGAGGDVASGFSGRDGNRESFGFSKYDGQWPSFEVEEAREIYKQKQIIKQLLDLLVTVKGNNPKQPLELLGVKREPVGREDSKKKDRESLTVESLGNALVKRADKIETYVFRLELLGRTTTLRDFIADMEPPFIVSDLKVHRAEGGIEAVIPFEENPQPFEFKPILPAMASRAPIITDVNSRFVLTIEYLMAIHASPEQFLRAHYAKKNREGKPQPPPAQVSTFLSDQVFDMKREEFDDLLELLYAQDSK